MASSRELSKLTTNMNTIPSNGRPSRNSQGICNMSQHPMEYTASQLDQQHTRKPVQPGTIIICDKIPLIVSNNGKIYHFTGGSFKQLYVANPSEHKLLASIANSPSTFSS